MALALALVAWGALLAATDVCERRLPNALTLPAVPAFWALAVAMGRWWAIAGGVAWSVLYLVTALCLPARGVRSVGGGDVKLAASLGVLAAWYGGAGWCVAVIAASCCSLLWMAVARRRSAPHGPAMLLCAPLGALVGALS